MAQMVKCVPTVRETQVQSLGWEDLLEKETATHSSILAWKIPRQKSLVGYSTWGCKELDTTEQLHFTTCTLCHLEPQPLVLIPLPTVFTTSRIASRTLMMTYCFSNSLLKEVFIYCKRCKLHAKHFT